MIEKKLTNIELILLYDERQSHAFDIACILSSRINLDVVVLAIFSTTESKFFSRGLKQMEKGWINYKRLVDKLLSTVN